MQDTLSLYEQLSTQGIIEIIEPGQSIKKNCTVEEAINVSSQYITNPDVVLREDAPDEGALLFNPDTNQVKVINTTGLFIWQQCGESRTLDEIVTEVQKGFDEVPLEEVAEDVQEFVDGMLVTGFIGTVE